MGKLTEELLTDAAIAALKPDPIGRYSKAVGGVKGLVVTVSPSGHRVFSVGYRIDGRKEKVTLEAGLVADARAEAHTIRAKAKKGVSTATAEREKKGKAKAASVAKTKAGKPMTLRALSWRHVVDHHIGHKALPSSERNKLIDDGPYRETEEQQRRWEKDLRAKLAGADVENRSWPEVWRSFNKIINPILGHKVLTEITLKDVIALVTRIKDENGSTSSRRCFAYLRKLMKWGRMEGLLDASPCADFPIQKFTGKDRVRDRSLSDDEIKLLWQATEHMDQWRTKEPTTDTTFRDFVRMLLVTGQRRGEVAGMRRSELQDGGKVWLIPSHRMKGKKAHAVPLPPLAREIIAARPQTGDCLFSTALYGDVPIACFTDVRNALDDAIKTTLKGKAPPDHFVLHDLRRTCRSGMAMLGIDSAIAERVLAHLPPGIESTYNKFDYLPQKRAALEKWAKHLSKIVVQM